MSWLIQVETINTATMNWGEDYIGDLSIPVGIPSDLRL